MQPWETALNKFLEKWKNKKEVIGAIVTGSYAAGTATQFSDIDVHIICKKSKRYLHFLWIKIIN